MLRLQFYNEDGQPLSVDEESGYAVHTQFTGWYVCGIRPADGRFVVRAGDAEWEMRWDRDIAAFRLPDKAKLPPDKRTKLEKQIKGAAGLLRFYRASGLPGDLGEELFPSLYISLASLTEAEYNALLERLAELAVLMESPVVAPVRGFSSTIKGLSGDASSRGLTSGQTLLQRAERFESLFRVVEQHWPLIVQRPARELRRKLVEVSVDHPSVAARPSTVIQCVTRPGRRTVRATAVVEDTNTAENRFLLYLLLDVLERHSKPLLRELERRDQWLARPVKLPRLPQRFRAHYQNLWQTNRRRRAEERKRVQRLKVEIERIQERVETHKAEPFLQSCRPELPIQPSQRLLRALDYGPVYAAFLNFGRDGDWQRFDKGTEILQAIEERGVRQTWDLYEKWVFLEVYWSLLKDFGFQPVEGDLLYDLALQNSQVTIPDGKWYKLALVLADGIEACKAEIAYDLQTKAPPRCKPGKACYDPDICPGLLCYRHIMEEDGNWAKQMRPDVALKITVGNKIFVFAIDAKYRRYEEQPVEEREKKKFGEDIGNKFNVDLLGTAKMQYLNGLGIHAAFVVHSDPKEQFTFWGGDRLFDNNMPHRERAIGLVEFWPGHRFGAVFASPLQPDNIQQLLKCILMYHCELHDICWNCRKRLCLENGGARLDWKKKPQGMSEQEAIAKLRKGGVVYYQCPDCDAFWIRQMCFGKGHLLIKLGRESFHTFSKNRPGNPWLNICPKCGSDLSVDYED